MTATGASPAAPTGIGVVPRWLGTVLGGPADHRTWAETLYVVVGAPLAVAGFVFVVVSTVLGIVLSVTFVGLPLLAVGGLAARRVGAGHRALVRRLLHEQVRPPTPFVPGRGTLGWLQSALRDGAAWRARAYLVVKLPLVYVSVLALLVWAESVYWLTYPFWWQVAGVEGPLPKVGLDTGTWPGASAVAVVGLVTIFAGPWALRALVGIDRYLVRWLLGRGEAERVRELEEARARIVEDAAARLRQIERDLHDGTQSQLGTLAMNLGQAKEKLEHRDGVPYDPDGALALVEDAHRHAKEALVELRDIVRGIHPPALDVGLDAALATLVARSAVPATLDADIRERPDPAIEAIAYYSAAELLANAARHSGARGVAVEVTGHDGRLRLQVHDDGLGGASPRAGSGLAGLASRLSAVDGRLDIHSPPGGPTDVTVELPLRT